MRTRLIFGLLLSFLLIESSDVSVAAGIDDLSPPTNPTISSSSHQVGQWKSDRTIDLIIHPDATDVLSGVAGYSVTFSKDTTEKPPQVINVSDTPNTTDTYSSAELGDGLWYANVRTVDNADNWTTAVHKGPFKIDTTKPTASIEINGGADYATERNVTLSISASDGAGSGPGEMDIWGVAVIESLGARVNAKRFYGASSSWEPFKTSKNWWLLGGHYEGVFLQIKDKAGNISDVAEDWIGLDMFQPNPILEAPFVSTRISKTTTFKVRWGAYVLGLSGVRPDNIDSYTVRYRPSTSRTWRTWKSNTKSTYGYFTGKAGVSYSFRVKAIDGAGNIGWSEAAKTIVPFNEGIYYAKTGFYGYKKNSSSQNYLSSVRYSYVRGHNIRYKLYNNNGIGLVVTKGPNMGKAKIYVDGKYVTTVDAYSSKARPRQLIYYEGFPKKGTHWLKVVNLGTSGRAKFEVDGVVVGR